MHNIPDFLRVTPEMQEHFAKGGMIKRADGSYSRRGLWDNIRANRGSGKEPTKEMLEQEAKIRAQEQYGGLVDEYGNGGYTVRRSNARKGKTHVVIGPDGTKKYFGDSKLGQHPKDPARKKAFYARHKHNLAHNPYFRAFARATWKDGGEIPTYASGTNYADPNQLTGTDMSNWNRFHDYAVQQGVNNDQSYNTDPSKGKALLAAYNAANPQNTVNENLIPAYQQYFNNLAAGTTAVGSFGTEMTNRWKNGVSPVDSFIGTQTMNSFTPKGRTIVKEQQPDGTLKTVSQTEYRAFTNNTNPLTNSSYKFRTDNYTNDNTASTQTKQTTSQSNTIPVAGTQSTPAVKQATQPTTQKTASPMANVDFNNYTSDINGVYKPIHGTGQAFKIVNGKLVPYNGTSQPATTTTATAIAKTKPTPSQPIAQTNTAPVSGMQTATLAYGGYYKDGGNYGAFYGRRDAAKMQRMFTPSANSMTPNFFANGGLTKYQTKGFVDEPTTGNSGQGVNTTTPAASPATATAPQNGMIGPPQPNWKDSSPNLDNYTMKGPQDLPASSNPASTSDIIANNQQYEDMMIKNYGVTRSDIDKRYAELSGKYKNAQSSDIYTALNKELADQAKINEQEKARKGEQARIKSIAGTMKGASQAIDAAFTGLDLLSQMAPNSNANAVRSQEIKNAAMNSKNIVGNRKGIEYAAYGGYAGLKEGVELDLTTQQIHELEKQGYKFQIL